MPIAFTRSAGVTGSEVSTVCDGVAARNAATDGKEIKPPVPPLKLLLRKRRNSPPNFSEWRPRVQETVSEYWKVVSPRPCGKPLIPPNQGFPVFALPTSI